MNPVLEALLSLVPPLLVGGVFWIVMRSIVRADSNERDAYAKIEAEERAKIEAKAKKKSS